LVWEDDLDRGPLLLSDLSVIGIGQTESDLAGSDRIGDLLIAWQHQGIVCDLLKKGIGLISHAAGQYGKVGCRGAEQWKRNGTFPFPLGIGQVRHAAWSLLGLRNRLGMDQQHPGPRRETDPTAVAGKITRLPTGGNLPTTRLQHPGSLHANRVQNLAIPEEIAAGIFLFFHQPSHQAQRLGSFDIKSPSDRDLRPASLECIQKGSRILAIDRSVKHYLLLRLRDATDSHATDPQP
jgi:hypothetical protein